MSRFTRSFNDLVQEHSWQPSPNGNRFVRYMPDETEPQQAKPCEVTNKMPYSELLDLAIRRGFVETGCAPTKSKLRAFLKAT